MSLLECLVLEVVCYQRHGGRRCCGGELLGESLERRREGDKTPFSESVRRTVSVLSSVMSIECIAGEGGIASVSWVDQGWTCSAMMTAGWFNGSPCNTNRRREENRYKLGPRNPKMIGSLAHALISRYLNSNTATVALKRH